MNLVAENVTVQKSPAAVRFHQNFDGGFFLRLAAENLGDDALHFPSIPFVEQPRAPFGHRVAADDQAGQPAGAAADQLARFDGRAVSAAEAGPGKNAGQHDPHCSGRAGAQRHPAPVQPVISDRQAVAAPRFEQVLSRHAEVAKDEPVVVRVLEGVQTIFDQMKMLVLGVGQIGNQDRGLVVDQTDQADRAAGNGIRDEQLLSVNDILVAVEHGPRAERCQIGPGARFGEGEC